MEASNDLYDIKKVLDGDTAAFAGILKRYSSRIFAVVVRIVGCREEAEELTQDVFMKVFSSLQRYKGNCEFSTWIYRIAYNTAISHMRKQRREISYIEESLYTNVSEEEVEQNQRREDHGHGGDGHHGSRRVALPEFFGGGHHLFGFVGLHRGDAG